MIKALQRMMEDNDVFIHIFPTAEGIKFMVCDNQCDINESYELHNENDLIQQLRYILEQW